ncbi:SPW repeat-containing protein [Pseudonocardia thermophila]|jgi:SPW repeat.|uniref:SPW repeat-containing protein n=1 Tax=Pseudonocardia thermophila TaxID=1848 RepID=A0A1M7A7P2_PSETH|nr:SPW repeat protein [Pseudonocardia thermophila]SHL38619.1 SPW repeat-containing protein [Pseudonocardia thermophila]
MATRAWTRWQDWAALVIGVLTALSPIVVETNAAALWTLIIFGVLIALASLWSLAAPDSVASEYVHLGLGVLLFIAPWVLGFTAFGGASWTAWIAGVLTVIAGAVALPEANQAHKGGAVAAH